MEKIKMITSKQAKESRLKLGISQNFIAKETGLSRPYLSNFEAGSFNPNDEFLETLKAFFEKHGIKFDNNKQDIKPKEDNIYKEETKTIKPINGIIPNLDNVSYNEALSKMADIGELNNDLFDLSTKLLPTKDNGIIFSNIVIDSEKVKELSENVIYRMAKAYLDIMDITGDSSINTDYNENITPLSELTTDGEQSVNDYVLHALNNIDDNYLDDEEEE
jgi:transcriptional regulator with XRE-family HTH domain